MQHNDDRMEYCPGLYRNFLITLLAKKDEAA